MNSNIKNICTEFLMDKTYNDYSPNTALEMQQAVDVYNAPFLLVDTNIDMFKQEITLLVLRIMKICRDEAIRGKSIIWFEQRQGDKSFCIRGYEDYSLTLLPVSLFLVVCNHVIHRLKSHGFDSKQEENGSVRISWKQ